MKKSRLLLFIFLVLVFFLTGCTLENQNSNHSNRVKKVTGEVKKAKVDEEGNSVDIMEKRIFAPNFIFVRDGYAEELVQKVSSKQENFNMKLNEEIV